MPILVRPVREQLEHDRIIRLLEAKWRRKFKVEANPGDERNAGIKAPVGTIYPDLVLTEEGGRKPKALVEVETSESVNHLEARAQWAHLAKSRTSLLLFVPAGAVESALRLASENAIRLAELWTYLVLGDQVRFTSVFRENGTEPADLIEKVDVFTTERTAPAPRPPVVVAPPEPVEPAPVPERPRKLAVKVGSRPPSADGVRPSALKPGLAVAKPGATMAIKVPPVPAAAPPAAKAAASAVSSAKAAAPPVPKAVPASPKAAKPEPAPAPAPVKAAAAKPVEKKTADKVEKVERKAPPEKGKAEKVVARPAPEKPEKKVAPVKAPPAKAAVKKPAPKPVVKKAAPVRPAARPAVKKAGPAKASRPGKRK